MGFDTEEIIETIRMIESENLDIRAVTLAEGKTAIITDYAKPPASAEKTQTKEGERKE